MSPTNCWLVSVPNQASVNDTIQFLKQETASTKNDLAECYEFELPSDLLVGTLDSLMALSDDLNRVDLTIEGIVRKIERQFNDLNQSDEVLTVDGVPIDRYLNHFAWDEAKHPHRRPLSEITSIIQLTMAKVDEELKQLSSMYSEKKQLLHQMTRSKKGGNLMVVDLDQVLTPDLVSKSDFVCTEYLQTLVVVVPKALENQWKEEYVQIGMDIADFADSTKGSPVVPGSSRKLLEEGEASIYTVTILKGKYQPGFMDDDGNYENGSVFDYVEEFKARAREKRFIAREFEFKPNAVKEVQEHTATLQVEVDRLWSGLLRWCKAHFGEVFIAWMHIKAIRVFVESVLRYGLPVDFSIALFRPHKGKDKKIRNILGKLYGHLQPKELVDSESAAQGGAEFYPYVSNVFSCMSV